MYHQMTTQKTRQRYTVKSQNKQVKE